MAKKAQTETDSVFFLKVVLYLILGTLWVTFTVSDTTYPVPFGLLIGLYFAHHEHFTIDRKIEYALLVVAAIASFIMPIGFILELN